MNGDLPLQGEEDGSDLDVDARALGPVSGGVAAPLRSPQHHLIHPPPPGRRGVRHQQQESVAGARHPLCGDTGEVIQPACVVLVWVGFCLALSWPVLACPTFLAWVGTVLLCPVLTELIHLPPCIISYPSL